MTKREQWEAGVSLYVQAEDGEALEYVSRVVYDRIVGRIQEVLQEQNRILKLNGSVEQWQAWKDAA